MVERLFLFLFQIWRMYYIIFLYACLLLHLCGGDRRSCICPFLFMAWCIFSLFFNVLRFGNDFLSKYVGFCINDTERFLFWKSLNSRSLKKMGNLLYSCFLSHNWLVLFVFPLDLKSWHKTTVNDCCSFWFGGILGSASRAEFPVSIQLRTGWAQDAWLQWSYENWFFHLDDDLTSSFCQLAVNLDNKHPYYEDVKAWKSSEPVMLVVINSTGW